MVRGGEGGRERERAKDNQPMEYPDRVTVYHKLSSYKDDHFLLTAISTYALRTAGGGWGATTDDREQC